MIGQAAKHPEKPRVLLRLRLFKPSSPTERTSFLAASMSREAKQLPNVLHIEQTPTGTTMHEQHLLCAYQKLPKYHRTSAQFNITMWQYCSQPVFVLVSVWLTPSAYHWHVQLRSGRCCTTTVVHHDSSALQGLL